MSNVTKGDRYPAWGMDLAYADTPELGKAVVQTLGIDCFVLTAMTLHLLDTI